MVSRLYLLDFIVFPFILDLGTRKYSYTIFCQSYPIWVGLQFCQTEGWVCDNTERIITHSSIWRIYDTLLGDEDDKTLMYNFSTLLGYFQHFIDAMLLCFSVYDSEKQLFILNFRGLSFSFPIESKFEVSLHLKYYTINELVLCLGLADEICLFQVNFLNKFRVGRSEYFFI
jgi:hypothetical protein